MEMATSWLLINLCSLSKYNLTTAAKCEFELWHLCQKSSGFISQVFGLGLSYCTGSKLGAVVGSKAVKCMDARVRETK